MPIRFRSRNRNRSFVEELAEKSRIIEKENVGAIAGADGWLFLSATFAFSRWVDSGAPTRQR